MPNAALCDRTVALRKQLLTPSGPADVYGLYNALFGSYPDWNLSPNQVIDAIVGREKAAKTGANPTSDARSPVVTPE